MNDTKMTRRRFVLTGTTAGAATTALAASANDTPASEAKGKESPAMGVGFHTAAFNSAYFSFDKCLAWAQRNGVHSIECGVIDGVAYHLGNHRMLDELGHCSPAMEQRITALEAEGKTAVMLVEPEGVQALMAVDDTIKDSSRSAVAELHALGIQTMMLTGDNPHTAKAIATQAGIDRAQGNLLPDDKLREIEALAQSGGVGMVGDGINDAPALARADIGFAMGAAGTDTAIETADVALMDDDLRKIPTFVRLSRTTAQVLTQNIALALGIKAVFLVLTFTGHATMWMAVFADMGASLLVVGNGLRLLRR